MGAGLLNQLLSSTEAKIGRYSSPAGGAGNDVPGVAWSENGVPGSRGAPAGGCSVRDMRDGPNQDDGSGAGGTVSNDG